MYIVDSHCHLDGLDYQTQHRDLQDVINKARERDVQFMLAVSVTLEAFPALKTLTGGYGQIVLSCGVHPLNLDTPWTPEQLLTLASDQPVVALGETGLDYFYQQAPEQQAAQQQAFREHIRIGRKLKKPVIVHSREARMDTLDILAEERVGECGGVLHCFTEDKQTAKKLLDLGMYISFSGIITFRSAEQIREAARYVPLDRLLIETDSPYLAPVPYRGKPNQPAYTRDIAKYLAVVKGTSLEALSRQTTQNFATLFRVSEQRLKPDD